MDEDEPTFKMAHNNLQEAVKFVTNITILVEDFMIDINRYDQYKQEDAYPEFVRKYVKELKTLDDYFKDASTKTVLHMIDDKLCNYIRKTSPDPKAIQIRTSEENIPSGHHILQQLVHGQPSPALDHQTCKLSMTLLPNHWRPWASMPVRCSCRTKWTLSWCSTCKQELTTTQSLRAHIISKHMKAKSKVCEETFGSSYALKIHLRKHSSSSKKYKCRVCAKEYTTVGHYK